jgi:hypothetical protein
LGGYENGGTPNILAISVLVTLGGYENLCDAAPQSLCVLVTLDLGGYENHLFPQVFIVVF